MTLANDQSDVACILFAGRFVMVGVEGAPLLEGAMTQDKQIRVGEDATKKTLDRRIEGVGWGVLLITIGTIWLMPEKHVPPGSWLLATGVIILALNAIRYFNGIQVSRFSLVVGILALFAGVGAVFNLDLPLLAIALIVMGASMLLKQFFESNSISSTARGWPCCGPREQESKQDRVLEQAVRR